MAMFEHKLGTIGMAPLCEEFQQAKTAIAFGTTSSSTRSRARSVAEIAASLQWLLRHVDQHLLNLAVALSIAFPVKWRILLCMVR